jgi:hypothetical protein
MNQQTKNSVAQIENKCRTLTFIQSTVDCANLRPQLVSYPSKIIQARLEFDAMVELDMTQMAPLQLVRLSKLKRILIQILNEQ